MLVSNLRRMSADAVAPVRQAINFRCADIVELESVLATFGVEAFQHPQDQFDPKVMKCVKRIRTSRASRHNHIADRLLPGYRRGETIVRPQCVTVFVLEERCSSQA